jgi:hypothetical protein
MRDGCGQVSFRRHLPLQIQICHPGIDGWSTEIGVTATETVTARVNNLGNLSLAHGREGKCIQQPLEPLVRMN